MITRFAVVIWLGAMLTPASTDAASSQNGPRHASYRPDIHGRSQFQDATPSNTAGGDDVGPSQILQDSPTIPDQGGYFGSTTNSESSWQQQDNGPPPQHNRWQQRPLTTSTSQPQRLPIHYNFRRKVPSNSNVNPSDNQDTNDFIPVTQDSSDMSNSVDNLPPLDDDVEYQSFASPRQDAVTIYMTSTPMGRYKLMMSSGLVGAAFGAFVGKSLFSSSSSIRHCISLWMVLFLFCTLLFNPYGELVRALGLAMIYTFQETKTVRQRYPIGWKRLKHALLLFSENHQQQRQPFPSRPDEFSRVYALVAMALIGSICGNQIPIIPSWLGSTILAVVLAFSTTIPDARGDLARIMAMRVVALARELWQIQQELEIFPKLGVVSGLMLDKVMILDRQHRIKEKVGTILTMVYSQIARVVQQSSSQQQQRSDDLFGDDSSRDRPKRPPLYPLDEGDDERRSKNFSPRRDNQNEPRPGWDQPNRARNNDLQTDATRRKPPSPQQQQGREGPTRSF